MIQQVLVPGMDIQRAVPYLALVHHSDDLRGCYGGAHQGVYRGPVTVEDCAVGVHGHLRAEGWLEALYNYLDPWNQTATDTTIEP